MLVAGDRMFLVAATAQDFSLASKHGIYRDQVDMFYIVCHLRLGSNVFETYWTTGRGLQAMDNSYGLLDLTVYGR